MIFRRSIALLFAFLPTPLFAQPPAAKEFFQDFRADQSISDFLKFTGPNADTIAKQDDTGLRITIPPTQLARETVGLRSAFRLKGDFEVTTSYQILHTEQPQDGNGIGFMLYLLTDSAKGDALGVYRVFKVREGDVFMVTRRSTNKAGIRETVNQHYPAPSASGQIRVTRTGAEAKVFVADGDAKDFRELVTHAFVPDEIKRIELMGYPGRADRPIMPQKQVDIRIKDLRIRAESFPFLPVGELRDVAPQDEAPAAAPVVQPEPSRTWLAVVISLGALFVFACVGVAGIWLFVRMRS
jgi:hypothetical protein